MAKADPIDPLQQMMDASRNSLATSSRKASAVPSDLSHQIPFLFQGLIPCRLVECLIKPGEAVERGMEMAVVEMDETSQDEQELVAGHEGPGYIEEDQSADSDLNNQESNNYQAESSNSDGSEDHEAVLMLMWDGSNGVLQEWCAQPGDVVHPGQVIAKVQSSARLAHLIQADQYAQKMRNERTDWGSGLNARFQNLTEKLVRSIASGSREMVHSDETLQTCNDLERVARDFMDTARTYGKVIISEIHLPAEAKTVRPLKLGGVLGGSKYVVRDVLFKLGEGDVFSEYPDPLYVANKIQGHELKGLKSYFATFFNAGTLGMVSFPLMAIIDFKGHRITAMSELPVTGKPSLILGSMDAGIECNVMNKDKEFSQIVNAASSKMGLKSHRVINGRSSGASIEITHCVDLEGHLGKDGKRYLLDFSRTFPPAYKAPELREEEDRSWPFYHMFRAEFLLRYQVFNRLSPDAYSSFQSPEFPDEKAQNHQDIKEASHFLQTQIVHNVCSSLRDSLKLCNSAQGHQRLSLSHMLHREGLNMRYLGIVYRKLVHEMYSQSMRSIYKEIIAEALMRTLKNHLRARLRDSDGESNQLSETKTVLNAFFGHSADEIEWVRSNPFVMRSLVSSFNFEPQDARHVIVTFRSNSVMTDRLSSDVLPIKYVVLNRLSESIGLVIDQEVMQDLRIVNGSVRRGFESQSIFEDLDFSFVDSVKQLDVIQRAFGLAQYLKAVRMMKTNASAAEQFLLRGFFMVEKILEASPLDPWLMGLMGDLSSALWMVLDAQCRRAEAIGCSGKLLEAVKATKEAADIFSARAERYYQESVSSAPVVAVLRNFAIFNLRLERLDEAEALLHRAMAACNNVGGTLNGQLTAEWELVAEIQDLLEEVELVRSGGFRKESIQYGGGVSIMPKLRKSPSPRGNKSVAHPPDSITARLKSVLRRKPAPPSPSTLRKSGRKPKPVSADTARSPRTISASDSFGATLSDPGSLSPGNNREMQRSEKEELTITTSRNKLLLQRLRGEKDE